jgi:hypothetical protein
MFEFKNNPLFVLLCNSKVRTELGVKIFGYLEIFRHRQLKELFGNEDAYQLNHLKSHSQKLLSKSDSFKIVEESSVSASPNFSKNTSRFFRSLSQQTIGAQKDIDNKPMQTLKEFG